MPAPLVQGIEVKTPTDLRRTMQVHDFIVSPLGKAPSRLEHALRECVDSIFDELQRIDRDDHEATCRYLRRIDSPLLDLHARGFQIIAVLVSGLMVPLKGRRVRNWSRAYYVVAPVGCFFRLGTDLADTVHCLDADCEEAMTALATGFTRHKRIVVWPDRSNLEAELEGCVPWCISCCVERMEAAYTVDRRHRLEGI